jgi:hypothetical protein
MSKVIDFYKQILSLGSLVADKDGLVSAVIEDMSVPFTVKEKRLALPTRHNLSKSTELCIVNPLVENVLRGESDVMVKYRNAINIRMNYVIACMMGELLTLITSPGEHQKLTPDQSELLSMVSQADEETLSRFEKIITTIKKAAANGDKDKAFVNIYLKKTANIKGKVYKRGAIITFPFYKELMKKEKTLYGVTLRNKDRESIQKLLEFIIPGIEVEDSYNQGSTGDISPFLDALLKGVLGIASNINSIATNYKNFLGMYDSYIYNADWVDTMENIHLLESEIRMIPMQAGNEGSVVGAAPNAHQPQLSVAPAVATPKPTYGQMAQMHNQAVANAPTAPAVKSDKLSFADIDQRNRAQYPNQPQMNQWGQAPNAWAAYTPAPMSGPVAARANISALAILASSQPQIQNGMGNQWNQPQNSFI